MMIKHIFGITTVAALTAFSALSAHADEIDASQHPVKFSSVRNATEVGAEAKMPVRISNAGTGYIGLTQSTVSSQAVKAEAAQFARSGRTSRGEIGLM